MFDPITIAAAVAGGSNIAGGVIGNLMNQNQQENEATRNQSNFNIQQDNFNRQLQIRVEDAKKAGLHPLYGLGVNAAQPSGSQPIVMQDSLGPSIREGGQSVSNILSRQATGTDRLKQNLELQILRSQVRETDARGDYYLSEAAKNNQAGYGGLGIQPQTPSSTLPDGQAPTNQGAGLVNIQAPPVLTSKPSAPGFISGINDYYQEWRLRDGFYLPLPRSEDEGPEETIENMSLPAWNGMLDQGQRMYGGNWKREMQDWRYKGIQPTGHYLSVSQQGPRERSRYGSQGKGYYREALDKEVNSALKGIKDWVFGGRINKPDWRR